MVNGNLGNGTQLTNLQMEVLSRYSQGRDLDQISDEMKLSTNAISAALETSMGKLNANNLVQAGFQFAAINGEEK